MLNIQVDPNGDVVAALQKAKDAGINLTVPFTLISKSWFRANRSIFTLKSPGKYPDYGGFNPGAPAWPNAQTTKRERAKAQKVKDVGFIYPMMKRRGPLESSLTDPTHPQSVNLIVNKVALYLGTRVEYAFYHQAKGARSKMPFRPVVFTGAEQVAPTELRNESTRWVNIIDDYMQQVLSRAFGGTPSGAV